MNPVSLILIVVAVVLLALAGSARVATRWGIGWLGAACFAAAWGLAELWTSASRVHF